VFPTNHITYGTVFTDIGEQQSRRQNQYDDDLNRTSYMIEQ